MQRFEPMNNIPRFRGRVQNFLSRKGYGFIIGDDGVKAFVHYSDIRGRAYRTLVPDEPVEYTLIQSPKGLQAVDVLRLDPPPTDVVDEIYPDMRTW